MQHQHRERLYLTLTCEKHVEREYCRLRTHIGRSEKHDLTQLVYLQHPFFLPPFLPRIADHPIGEFHLS
jgi:hypothetical protein